MENADNIFYNDFDYFDDEKRNKLTLEKINSLIGFARKNSDFYSTRLPKKGIPSLTELKNIPILTQQDLKENLPPYHEGIITKALSEAYVFTSGGTTGTPKFTFYAHEDITKQGFLCAKGLFLPGIRNKSRAANMMNAGNLWASFTFVNKALEHCGSLILPIAAQTSIEATVNYMRLFKVNAAIGIPSFFISLADYCEENNVTDLAIEILATGGEQIYPEAKKHISKVLGVKKFVSAGYSSNDTGLIGFNCEKLEGSLHHIHEDSVHVEIVDPNTGQALENGKAGKILVSCLDRFMMPLIRYDIGDMGCIIDKPCNCGRKLKLLELMGRSDDALIIGGYNITPSVISKLISHLDELSFHFQIIAKTIKVKDLLQVNIETKANVTKEKQQNLEQQFLKLLMQEEKALTFLYDSKAINLPQVFISNPNSLPRNAKTGKLKQVIDKRMA